MNAQKTVVHTQIERLFSEKMENSARKRNAAGG